MTAPAFNDLLLPLEYYNNCSSSFFQVSHKDETYFLSLVPENKNVLTRSKKFEDLTVLDCNVNESNETVNLTDEFDNTKRNRYVSLLSSKCTKLFNILTSVSEFYPLLSASPLPFSKEETKQLIKEKLKKYTDFSSCFQSHNFVQFLLIYDCPYHVIENQTYYVFNKKDIELFMTDVKMLFLIFLNNDFFLILLLKQLTLKS